MSQNSERSEDTIVEIINEFIIFYKDTYQINIQSLFDNIDEYDPTSTNIMLEEFYETKNKYEDNIKNHPEWNKIYKNKIDFEVDELYGINKNDDLYVISPSLFALLIEIVNFKHEMIDDKFKIIIIKTN